MAENRESGWRGAFARSSEMRRRMLTCLLPWILRPNRDSPAKALGPTAYLDGLRGVAAFLVYWGHHESLTHIPSPLEFAYGFDGRHLFATLPIIRNFFSGGQFAIAIFYTISGYVLSTRSLSLVHKGRHLELGDSIASALFRRWARLFLPAIAVSFVFLNILQVFNIWNSAFQKKDSYLPELERWFSEIKRFSFLFSSNTFFLYDVYLWSIPLEFKGSIAIYTTLFAVSRLRRNIRFLIKILLFVYFTFFLITEAWYCAMFMSGMLLADLDLVPLNDRLPPRFKRFTLPNHAKTGLFALLFLLGLYLGGVPDQGPLSQSPGWRLLSYLAPVRDEESVESPRFFQIWAAPFVMAAIPRVGLLRASLESRLAQYLGRISYALYLVHGPVQWTLGVRLYAAAGIMPLGAKQLEWWRDRVKLPKAGPLGLEVAFLLPQLVLLPLTFWLAEMTASAVDESSVRLARYVYERGLGPDEADEPVYEELDDIDEVRSMEDETRD